MMRANNPEGERKTRDLLEGAAGDHSSTLFTQGRQTVP